ncbi:hypothetical protein ID866_10923 [Astraeus odoratus]|nr:hypothetical protein ID866_10923 [Astraeus odoratus]
MLFWLTNSFITSFCLLSAPRL